MNLNLVKCSLKVSGLKSLWRSCDIMLTCWSASVSKLIYSAMQTTFLYNPQINHNYLSIKPTYTHTHPHTHETYRITSIKIRSKSHSSAIETLIVMKCVPLYSIYRKKKNWEQHMCNGIMWTCRKRKRKRKL